MNEKEWEASVRLAFISDTWIYEIIFESDCVVYVRRSEIEEFNTSSNYYKIRFSIKCVWMKWLIIKEGIQRIYICQRGTRSLLAYPPLPLSKVNKSFDNFWQMVYHYGAASVSFTTSPIYIYIYICSICSSPKFRVWAGIEMSASINHVTNRLSEFLTWYLSVNSKIQKYMHWPGDSVELAQRLPLSIKPWSYFVINVLS